MIPFELESISRRLSVQLRRRVVGARRFLPLVPLVLVAIAGEAAGDDVVLSSSVRNPPFGQAPRLAPELRAAVEAHARLVGYTASGAPVVSGDPRAIAARLKGSNSVWRVAESRAPTRRFDTYVATLRRRVTVGDAVGQLVVERVSPSADGKGTIALLRDTKVDRVGWTDVPQDLVLDPNVPGRIPPLVKAKRSEGAPFNWVVGSIRLGELDRMPLPDLTIALIDTGVKLEDAGILADKYVNEAEESGVTGFDDDQNGFVDDQFGVDFTGGHVTEFPGDPYVDEADHGTRMASLVFGAEQGAARLEGPVPGARILPLRVASTVDTVDAYRVASALQYAANRRAQIVIANVELGNSTALSSVSDGVVAVQQAGGLVVAPVGNSTEFPNNDNNNVWPASGVGVLSVLSTAFGDVFGGPRFGKTTVALGAPGESVPTIGAGGLASFSGSCAAAAVAGGAAARLWGFDGLSQGDAVRKRLMATVRRVKSLDGRCESGGTIDLGRAFRNETN